MTWCLLLKLTIVVWLCASASSFPTQNEQLKGPKSVLRQLADLIGRKNSKLAKISPEDNYKGGLIINNQGVESDLEGIYPLSEFLRGPSILGQEPIESPELHQEAKETPEIAKNAEESLVESPEDQQETKETPEFVKEAEESPVIIKEAVETPEIQHEVKETPEFSKDVEKSPEESPEIQQEAKEAGESLTLVKETEELPELPKETAESPIHLREKEESAVLVEEESPEVLKETVDEPNLLEKTENFPNVPKEIELSPENIDYILNVPLFQDQKINNEELEFVKNKESENIPEPEIENSPQEPQNSETETFQKDEEVIVPSDNKVSINDDSTPLKSNVEPQKITTKNENEGSVDFNTFIKEEGLDFDIPEFTLDQKPLFFSKPRPNLNKPSVDEDQLSDQALLNLNLGPKDESNKRVEDSKISDKVVNADVGSISFHDSISDSYINPSVFVAELDKMSLNDRQNSDTPNIPLKQDENLNNEEDILVVEIENTPQEPQNTERENLSKAEEIIASSYAKVSINDNSSPLKSNIEPPKVSSNDENVGSVDFDTFIKEEDLDFDIPEFTPDQKDLFFSKSKPNFKDLSKQPIDDLDSLLLKQPPLDLNFKNYYNYKYQPIPNVNIDSILEMKDGSSVDSSALDPIPIAIPNMKLDPVIALQQNAFDLEPMIDLNSESVLDIDLGSGRFEPEQMPEPEIFKPSVIPNMQQFIPIASELPEFERIQPVADGMIVDESDVNLPTSNDDKDLIAKTSGKQLERSDDIDTEDDTENNLTTKDKVISSNKNRKVKPISNPSKKITPPSQFSPFRFYPIVPDKSYWGYNNMKVDKYKNNPKTDIYQQKPEFDTLTYRDQFYNTFMKALDDIYAPMVNQQPTDFDPLSYASPVILIMHLPKYTKSNTPAISKVNKDDKIRSTSDSGMDKMNSHINIKIPSSYQSPIFSQTKNKDKFSALKRTQYNPLNPTLSQYYAYQKGQNQLYDPYSYLDTSRVNYRNPTFENVFYNSRKQFAKKPLQFVHKYYH